MRYPHLLVPTSRQATEHPGPGGHDHRDHNRPAPRRRTGRTRATSRLRRLLAGPDTTRALLHGTLERCRNAGGLVVLADRSWAITGQTPDPEPSGPTTPPARGPGDP